MGRAKMMGLEMVVVVLGLLAMAQQSLQMSLKNPLHAVIERVNERGPFFGLVLVTETNERDLLATNAFCPSDIPPLLVGGRVFNVGKIKDVDVIYVRTERGSINAAAATELLVDVFNIVAIVHFGSAGAVNNSLLPGDVVAPSLLAFTGAWKWKHFKAKTDGQLKFGDFNYPEPGENTLGSINFRDSKFITPSGKTKSLFWLRIRATWSENVDLQLQRQDLGVPMQKCINSTTCLPRDPKYITGSNASTADIYLLNRAYREYLYTELHVATVDEESIAVASVGYSNNLPVIVFRGISNTAGGSLKYKPFFPLGSINAARIAVTFIGYLAPQTKSEPQIQLLTDFPF